MQAFSWAANVDYLPLTSAIRKHSARRPCVTLVVMRRRVRGRRGRRCRSGSAAAPSSHRRRRGNRMATGAHPPRRSGRSPAVPPRSTGSTRPLGYAKLWRNLQPAVTAKSIRSCRSGAAHNMPSQRRQVERPNAHCERTRVSHTPDIVRKVSGRRPNASVGAPGHLGVKSYSY